jgi:hypothetical protein
MKKENLELLLAFNIAEGNLISAWRPAIDTEVVQEVLHRYSAVRLR